MADLTIAEITLAVRSKLGDLAFDQTVILDAANAFMQELYHNTRTRRMESNDQLYPAIGDTAVDLPDDMDIWLDLSVISPNVYSINRPSGAYFEYADFKNAFPGWATNTAKQLSEWSDFGGQMRFSAPLALNTTIDIDYNRKPVPAASASSSIELDEEYKELAVIGTFARCMEANEDYAEAATERDNLAPLVTSWTRNEARGGGKAGPIIMRTNRRPGGYGRGRDWN